MPGSSGSHPGRMIRPAMPIPRRSICATRKLAGSGRRRACRALVRRHMRRGTDSATVPSAGDVSPDRRIAVVGVIGTFAAFGLFYLGLGVFHLDHAHVQTLIYLKLSVAGHLTIFLTRTRGPFWSIRPARILSIAVLGTQAIATLIAVYGLFMAPLGPNATAKVKAVDANRPIMPAVAAPKPNPMGRSTRSQMPRLRRRSNPKRSRRPLASRTRHPKLRRMPRYRPRGRRCQSLPNESMSCTRNSAARTFLRCRNLRKRRRARKRHLRLRRRI